MTDTDASPMKTESRGTGLMRWIWGGLFVWILLIATGAWLYRQNHSFPKLLLALAPGTILLFVWALAFRLRRSRKNR